MTDQDAIQTHVCMKRKEGTGITKCAFISISIHSGILRKKSTRKETHTTTESRGRPEKLSIIPVSELYA